MRRLLPLAAAAALAAPGLARADGLPVGNVEVGPQGVVVPGAPDRIVALPAGGDRTLVARIARDGGYVERSLRLAGRWTIPGVALDGTADGRSADGRTAVLLRPRRTFPQRRTRLLVLGVRPLELRRRVTLAGDFSFDALSSDGRRMYLVHYVDRGDPRRYVVRSYDVRRGRLEPGAIVDAREPDEDMRGFPVTRLTTRDGRWAYTLYDGGGEPFVHALDTAARRAFCIDLPMLTEVADPYALRLRLEEDQLLVTDPKRTRATIHRETMQAAPVLAAARVVRPPAAASGPDWLLTGVLAAVALGGTGALVRRRRRA